jgi:hypothetical protein
MSTSSRRLSAATEQPHAVAIVFLITQRMGFDQPKSTLTEGKANLLHNAGETRPAPAERMIVPRDTQSA